MPIFMKIVPYLKTRFQDDQPTAIGLHSDISFAFLMLVMLLLLIVLTTFSLEIIIHRYNSHQFNNVFHKYPDLSATEPLFIKT
jgi:hypothetical protein